MLHSAIKHAVKSAVRKRVLSMAMDRMSLLQASLLQLEKRVDHMPFFVQVGANDGVSFDPFFDVTRRWQGLMVEPQPAIFELLKKSRGDQAGLKFANAAVSPEQGNAVLYELSFPAGRAGSGLASMNRDVLQKHIDNGYVEECARACGASLPPDRSAWIVERRAECCPLGVLLTRYGISEVNALLIDTEGYDFEVLRTYPWERQMPELVIYEEMHLDEAAKRECRAFLKSKGYALIGGGANAIAVLGS